MSKISIVTIVLLVIAVCVPPVLAAPPHEEIPPVSEYIIGSWGGCGLLSYEYDEGVIPLVPQRDSVAVLVTFAADGTGEISVTKQMPGVWWVQGGTPTTEKFTWAEDEGGAIVAHLPDTSYITPTAITFHVYPLERGITMSSIHCFGGDAMVYTLYRLPPNRCLREFTPLMHQPQLFQFRPRG